GCAGVIGLLARRSTAPGNQPFSCNSRQVVNAVVEIVGLGRLDDRQIETVGGEPRKGIVRRTELHQEGLWLATTLRPAIEITQQRRLMRTAKKDFRIGTRQPGSDRGQTQGDLLCAHAEDSTPREFRWAAVGGDTGTSALAVFRSLGPRRPASS